MQNKVSNKAKASKKYRKPKLKHYGKLADITQGGGFSQIEHGNPNAPGQAGKQRL